MQTVQLKKSRYIQSFTEGADYTLHGYKFHF